MKLLKDLTQKELKIYLKYDPKTGNFIWRKRTPNMFKPGKRTREMYCNLWNTKFANKTAGAKDSEGYIIISINRKKYKAHRLAFLYVTGKWPPFDIDHINKNTADNSWKNLRKATRSQNNANSKLRGNNTSTVCGVCWSKQAQKWETYGTINGKRSNLGMYDSLDEAREVRIKWEIKNFGEYRNAKRDIA